MEEYTWEAELTDGTYLIEQKDAFKSVLEANKLGKLSNFLLKPQKTDKKPILVSIGGNRKLIFVRRRMNHEAPYGKFMWTIHMLGWEENIKGVNIKSIMYIYPNGQIEMNNDEPRMARFFHEIYINQFKQMALKQATA